MCTCVNIQNGVMAAFEVTTNTYSITVTWTNDDVKSLANFTIALERTVVYTGRTGSTSPYTKSGLTAGTTHIVQIETYTTDGRLNTPVAAAYALSMLSNNK